MGNDPDVVYGSKERNSTPCHAMVVPCDTDDAEVCGGREVRHGRDGRDGVCLKRCYGNEMDAAVKDIPTAPHPISPKFRSAFHSKNALALYY